MSGFIVVYNKSKAPVDQHLLGTLTETLKMRGPDAQRVRIDGYVGMGHALFKTTFESEYENQPASLDGKVWIVCSARIDDREHLVSKLGLKREIDLYKIPDSELILHAYRKWGEECPQHLLGDFAFVIWDSREKKLFCATDIFAKKQIYYVETKNSFLMSNNIHTLLQHPEVFKEPNEKALVLFLMFGGHAWTDKHITAFQNIFSLSPAYYGIYQDSKFKTYHYWRPVLGRPILKYRNKQDYVEHFLEIFTQAIEDRVRTEKVGLRLSGGMDSGSIAGILAHLRNTKYPNVRINALTVLHKRGSYDCGEKPYAQEVANHLNLNIDFLYNNAPFLKADNATIQPIHIFTPNFGTTVEKKHSQIARVFLSGHGSDELFKPSPLMNALFETNPFQMLKEVMYLNKLYKNYPYIGLRSSVKKYLGIKATKKPPYHFRWLRSDLRKKYNIENIENTILAGYVYPSGQRHPEILDALKLPSWYSEGQLLNPNFTHSEYRDPYLDQRLIEFVLSLPTLPWFHSKHLLRLSMKDILPKKVLLRPKTPLYGLQEALVKDIESQWVYHWKPSKEMSKFIDFGLLEKESHILHGYTDIFIKSRIYLLDTWLKNVF